MERAKLIVKNFGPLKDIEIEVRPMVTLIGAQASGKSTLAKLLSILEDDNFRENAELENFVSALEAHNIQSHLNDQTVISYKSSFDKHFPYFVFSYSIDLYETYNPKDVIRKIKEINKTTSNIQESLKRLIATEINICIAFDTDYSKIFKLLPENFKKNVIVKKFLEEKILNKFDDKDIDFLFDLIEKKKTIDEYINFYEQLFQTYPSLFNNDSLYIPAERNLLHLIEGNTMGLIKNKIQIPLHILNVGQEYEKALHNIKRIPINIISKNLKYVREDKTSYIYHNKFEKINLLESSSGLQTVIPILLLVEYSNTLKNKSNFNFIIEEPELNLYPKAQYELIKHLIKNCFGGRKNLVLTTHSPFILAAINNLLLAGKKGKTSPELTNKIIKKTSWLNSEDFIAYELKNGKAKKITDDKVGLIKENMIDSVSDFFSDEFDKLLDV